MALSQADRLLSQYRCRLAQADAEVCLSIKIKISAFLSTLFADMCVKSDKVSLIPHCKPLTDKTNNVVSKQLLRPQLPSFNFTQVSYEKK